MEKALAKVICIGSSTIKGTKITKNENSSIFNQASYNLQQIFDTKINLKDDYQSKKNEKKVIDII